MTIQHLFVAELADVQNIQIRCKCGAQLWFNVDAGALIPDECPQCLGPWTGDAMGQLSKVGIDALLQLVRQARTKSEDRSLKVNLVFNHKSGTEG